MVGHICAPAFRSQGHFLFYASIKVSRLVDLCLQKTEQRAELSLAFSAPHKFELSSPRSKGPSQKFAEACETKNVSFILNPPPSPLKRTEIAKQASTFETSTVGNLLQKRVHVLPDLLNVVGHLRDNRSLDRW